MKKRNLLLLFFSFVVVGAIAPSTLSAKDDKPIEFGQLPQKTQVFVEQHFNKNDITTITADRDSYDVTLKNTKIEFQKNGNWDNVEGTIPASVVKLIPPKIVSYLDANYKKNSIQKIDKELKGYTIDLDGDVELEFDAAGKFLRMDR